MLREEVGACASLLLLLLERQDGTGLLVREASPLLVIVAGHHSGGLFDEHLGASPEVEVREHGLEPAISDAVVAIEGHLVMDAMNDGREDDASLLEDDGDERRVGHVRPRVELVRQGDPEARPNPEVEHEEGPGKDGTVNVFRVFQNHPNEDGQGRKAVVAIGLEKIVLAHRSGSHVMFAEGANERCANKRGVERSPRIGRPMQKSGAEVGEEHGEHEGDRGDPQVRRAYVQGEVDEGNDEQHAKCARVEHVHRSLRRRVVTEHLLLEFLFLRAKQSAHNALGVSFLGRLTNHVP